MHFCRECRLLLRSGNLCSRCQANELENRVSLDLGTFVNSLVTTTSVTYLYNTSIAGGDAIESDPFISWTSSDGE